MTTTMIPSLSFQLIDGDGSGHYAYELMSMALASVLRHAQEGKLPMFARTFGLAQPALLSMVECCLPRLDYREAIPERKYAALMHTAPSLFHDLVGMLNGLRTPRVSAPHADWLARAIAAASLGGQLLWQDLGLQGREGVTELIRYFFAPLYARNTEDLKWKRFLFMELGKLHGKPGMKAPGCGQCDQFATCFAMPAASTY